MGGAPAGKGSVDCLINAQLRLVTLVAIFALLMVLVFTSAYFQKKHINMIHASIPCLILSVGFSYSVSSFAHKSIASNALTNTFIYQFLLPIIVLAEGFNNRKKSLGLYRKEIISLGLLMPILNFFVMSGLLIGIQKVFVDKMGLVSHLKQDISKMVAICITMNTVDVHSSIAPLHSMVNKRLEKIIWNSSTFNNNMALVLVMTFERMILSGDITTSSAVSNFMKVGALSVILGFMIGGLITYCLKKFTFLNENTVLETLYIVLGSYFCYSLAHLKFFQLSGDVAIFFYGIMMTHYNKFNMNVETFRNIG